MSFNTILLPVDGSESSMNAGKLALELALAFGSHVHVMHCYDEIPGTIGGSAREEITHKEAVSSCELMAPYKVMFEKEVVPCKLYVAHGDVAQEIMALLKDVDGDVIVMGHRGLGGAQGFVLGSVSQKILKLSHVPVLIAR